MDKTIKDSKKHTNTAIRKQEFQYFSVTSIPQNKIAVLQYFNYMYIVFKHVKRLFLHTIGNHVFLIVP